MKKLLTILILLLTVVSQSWAIVFNTQVNEVVVANTEVIMASNWSSYLQIDANKFTYAKGGDVITVYYKDNNSGSIKLCSGASGWPTLDSSFDSGASLDANANKFQYELTSDNASAIKANGLIVSGANYTIDCVILTHNPEVVSTSTYEINWSGGAQPTITGFNNLEVGDYIRISVSNTNSNTQINYKRSWDDNVIYSTTTEFHVTDANDVTYIKDNGIIFTGCDYTLKEVTIEKQPSALELMSGECRTLFSGTQETTWTKVCEKDASWGGLLAPGDQIKITVSDVPVADYHHVWITNSSGTDTAIDDGNAKPEVTEANTYIITLTADEVNAMSSGFAIWGQNVTVTKVELYKPLYALTTTATNGSISVKNGGNVENNRRFETVTNLTLTATADDYYSFSGWTVNGSDEGSKKTLNLSMDADKNVVATFAVSEMTSGETRTLFSGTVSPSYGEICALGSDWGALLAEGDQIKITVSEVLTGDYHYVWITNSSGTAIDDGNAKPDVTEANTYIITLTADEVTAMRSGFAIWGQNVTVTNVELYRPVSYTLTTDVTPTGSGTILVQTVVENVATDTDATSFASGTNLKLTANPAANYAFSKWTVGSTDYNTNPYEFTITEAVTATATFVPSITTASFSEMGTDQYTGNVLSASGSIQAYIGSGSTISGTRFNVTTSAPSKLSIQVYYVGDSSPSVYETITTDADAKKSYELKLDKTKMIEKIQIYNQSDSDVTFSSISLGQDDDATGTITTDDMPIGWSSTYTPGTKTVAFEGAADSWPARGWNVGGTSYNGKSITVTFTSEPALENGVITLVLEYYDAHGALKKASNVNTGNTIELEVPDGTQAVKRAYLTVASTGTFVLSEITATTIVKYTLTKNATNGAIRVVKSNGDVTTDTEIKAGEVLKLWAIGDDGYDFTEWTIGGSTSTANPYTLTMDAAKEVTATFATAPTDPSALWSGSKAINWNTVEIAASNFASANAGDKIVINVSYVGDVDWPKVVLRKNESDPLSGAEDTQLSSSMTSVTYYINESMLADLKQNGLFVSGAGYRLKSVKLEADDDPTTVWTGLVAGSTNFDTNDVLNTNNKKILAGVEAKDTIYIYTTGVATGASYELKYKVGDNWTWTKLISGASVPEIIKYAATAESAPLIATRGLVISGSGYSINKISLHKFKETPLTAGETRNLHTSSGDVIDWNPICEKGASYGALLQAGDVFQITVSALTSGTDNHQVVLRGGSHDEGTSVKATGMVEIVVTADILSNYTSGFSITGTGVTISKVDLFRPKAVSRTERMMNESEVVMDGSNGATVNSGRFANASAYDVLRVYFTNTSGATSTSAEEDKMHLILKYNGESDNWDYIKEMRFAGSETQFEIPLTQSVLALLKKNGLQITGSGYTFKSVTIKTAGEVPSDGEDDISNDASEEAKKVYNVLKNLYGKKIVSGVVANVDWNTKEAENVYNWTGKYPAMNVYDYINLHASKDVNSAGWVDYSDITTAKNWWKEGGIVGAMWHWQVKANNGTDYTCTPGTAAGETSFDASKVYVDGTSENTLAKQQLDQLCGYLKKMQDAGIPVVWRPLHEASGNVEQNSGGKAWFWWGAKGADVYKQLWQWMYNYMVKTKGLNNLIWVWTSQTNDHNWYPGDAYVDIIGRDNYGAKAATLATEYEALKAAYPNKMITLSECGNSESTEMAKLSSIWDAGSRWSWFMTWYDGDYNDGKTTTHKHAGETWWKDAVSKDYVITRDKMKELLGQESSDDSKTGVNISLDDLNEGWSSSYNATTKTITTEGEWAARGWYIGDNRYNSKGSVTVKFEAVDFGVTLKMEYTNTGGESKSVSAGAAAGETEVELDIPADIKTMDKVYITYQPIGTLKLTAATVNDKVVDNRTERTLVEKSQAISDGDIAINRGLFSNAVAGDVLRIYADGLSESSKLALEPGDYSGAFDGANWTGFTESPFKLKLTATLIATIKEKGLLIRGESFTFKKAVLYTEKELGSEISDEEKKGDEEKDDEEKIIDKKTGEADLTVLSAQDDTKTTLTQNEDGSITMTTTEPYCAAQIWFNDPEPVAGNVLKVELVESKVNVTITVQYTDGTQSQMSANTSGVATARAATRGDSDPGTTIEVPLETGKEVQNIEVKNNVAGTITIKKMQVTTINIFTNGVANLSMLKPQSNATYDTSTHTLATTKGWTGATISPVDGEKVSGKELLIEFADASKVKVAVKYRTDVEGPSTIMEKAAKAVRLALDNTKNIQEISIQPTEASIVTFKKIAVNSEESDDGTLKPGKTITLWESAAGETLSWNEVAKQDASVGEMLQEYDELLITISGVTDGCDWPKVFIRDASSEQAGNEVLLNDVGSFPYTVRIVLTGEMAQQLQKGFSICGDGVTVTKLQVYRPEAPKTGDIHLSDLNYGYNSSYDKGTHTITTTARWAARGWEIGDKRYNDKNLITVKFEPVDFPVTLKMEYTTGLQTAQATSVGVPAGRTELLLEIPSGISKLDRVYIIYENPGSVKLTEASVTYQDKLKLSTAIEAFEAEGVIHDGRYDTDGWYNLRGMRIAEPKTSGIYIHGGKKVVIY